MADQSLNHIKSADALTNTGYALTRVKDATISIAGAHDALAGINDIVANARANIVSAVANAKNVIASATTVIALAKDVFATAYPEDVANSPPVSLAKKSFNISTDILARAIIAIDNANTADEFASTNVAINIALANDILKCANVAFSVASKISAIPTCTSAGGIVLDCYADTKSPDDTQYAIKAYAAVKACIATNYINSIGHTMLGLVLEEFVQKEQQCIKDIDAARSNITNIDRVQDALLDEKLKSIRNDIERLKLQQLHS